LHIVAFVRFFLFKNLAEFCGNRCSDWPVASCVVVKAAGLHPAERAVCVNCAAYVSYNRMQVYNRDPFRSHELRCDCIILLDDGIAAVRGSCTFFAFGRRRAFG